MAGFCLLKPDVWILNGPINDHSLMGMWKALVRIDKKAEICLLLDSEGGQVEGTMGWIHEARKKLLSLEVRVVGEASSAAVHLIQAAGEGGRTAVPSARFFTHPMVASVDLHPAGSYSHARSLGTLNQHWVEILAARSGRPLDFWNRWLQTDHYFDAQRALSLGLIDEIV